MKYSKTYYKGGYLLLNERLLKDFADARINAAEMKAALKKYLSEWTENNPSDIEKSYIAKELEILENAKEK